jgi:hypothetical protein
MAKKLTVHDAIRKFGYYGENSLDSLFPYYRCDVRETSHLEMLVMP